MIQELEKKCNIYGNGFIKYGKIEEGRQYLQLPRDIHKGVLV